MTTSSRLLAGAAAALLASFALAAAAGAKSASKTVKDSGTADLSITHANSTFEFAAGNVYDKRLGPAALAFTVKVLPQSTGTISVEVKKAILYTATGSLSGTASADVTVTGDTENITNGKLSLTKGLGSLKGDSFTATFTGTGSVSMNQFLYTYSGKLTKS